MSTRKWREVSRVLPCPACGKPDWCAWTEDGWLKCERATEAPAGMNRVVAKGGGALFRPDDDRPPPKRKAPDARQREGATSKTPTVYTNSRLAIRALDQKLGAECASQWEYHDAHGNPVGLVARWNARDGKDKTYRPISRTPDGWVIGAMPEPRPLFRLPDLLAEKPDGVVWVVEGEKCADTGKDLGLLATNIAGGCKAAGKADWFTLSGRDVVVLPDNDHPGEHYAQEVTRRALAAGARSVRIARLIDLWPEMPQGGDLADLVEHRSNDLDVLRNQLLALATTTNPERIESPEATTKWRPFPTETLPEPMRSLIVEGAIAIGCDHSYIALPLLAAAAAAIGATHRIRLKPGWEEPAILWTAFVGESGTMKSPAFRLALAATHRIQAEAMRVNELARAKWKSDLSERKRNKDSDSSLRELVEPTDRRVIVADTTTEALAPLLRDNPRGLLLARDELNGWLSGFDRYAKTGRVSADLTHYLAMHGGDPLTVDRKTSKPIFVPSAAVCITGGIQPGILQRAVTREHRDSGLLARLLLAMPPRQQKRWTLSEVSEHAKATTETVFRRLHEMPLPVDEEGVAKPDTLTLSPEAQAQWAAFVDEHGAQQVDLVGDEAAAWGKIEGSAARLTLVIHLFRWSADDPTLRDPMVVDEPSIEAGIRLARWFGTEALRVYEMFSESDHERERRELIEWIKVRGGVVTARDLQRGPQRFRSSSETAETALQDLVESGYGQWEMRETGGRPVKVFHLFER
jgi:uncharacterized protein DUF3987